MLLSIGMIVKNEEKYLDRCLTALKPLIDKLGAELIIADTGSTDNSVVIAKKHTDKVFHFEWINDFAAARNFTLEKARGEWFMFCDADEIFQSCNNLINFFRSDLCHNYERAAYKIRNYISADKDKGYTDQIGTRLARKTPGLRFEGRIHEHFSLSEDDTVLLLEDVANHFGYAYDTPEEKERKFKRNIELIDKLLEESEEPPLSLYLQAADMYALMNDKNGIKYIERGIEAARGSSDGKNAMQLLKLLHNRIKFYFRRNEFDTALKYCDEYLGEEKSAVPGEYVTDTDVYFYRGYICYSKKSFAEAEKAYLRFNDLFLRVESGSLLTADTLIAPLDVSIRKNYNLALSQLVSSSINCGHYELASEYIDKVLPETSETDILKEKLGMEFDIMRGRNDYSRAEKVFRELDDNGKAYFDILVHREIKNSADRERLINIFGKIYEDKEKFREIADPDSTVYEEKKAVKQETVTVNMKGNIFVQFSAKRLVSLLEKGGDITEVLPDEKYDLTRTVEYCAENIEDYFTLLSDYSADLISESGLRGALALIEGSMKAALKKELNIDKLFSLWGKTGLRICEAEKLSPDSLPDNIFAAVMAAEADDERSRKNYKEAVAALTALVKKYPPSKPVVLSIRDSIQKEIDPPAAKKTSASADELARGRFKELLECYNAVSGADKKQAFEIIYDKFLRPYQDKQNERYSRNLRAMADYPYKWGDCGQPSEEPSFMVFPVTEREYCLYDKNTGEFSGLVTYITKDVSEYYFNNDNKPLFIEHKRNISDFRFLNDVVRRSEDFGKDNHIYLYYDSFDEFAPLLMLCDLGELLEDRKFVFLFGGENRDRYPVDFTKEFGENYGKTERPLQISELNRVCFWYKHAHSGSDLTMGVLNSNKYVQTEKGHDFNTYSKINDAPLAVSEDFRSAMNDPETVFSADRLYDTAHSPEYTIKLDCDDLDAFIAWLKEKRPYPHEYTVNELFRGYFLFHYEARGFEPRFVPLLVYDPHIWDPRIYDKIFLSFKYHPALTCMRDPIMSFARCYIIGIAGWNAFQTEYLLASDYTHAQFLSEEFLDDYYGIRFEDLKQFPEKVCPALCRHLNIPYDKAMLKTKAPKTDRFGHTTVGFDQTPLHWDISSVLSDFDKMRLKMFYEPIYKYYGYTGFDSDEHPVDPQLIKQLFSYPFRFEKLLYNNVTSEEIHSWVQKVLQTYYKSSIICPKLIPFGEQAQT